LLVTSLQETLSHCTQELSVVQDRLFELLGRFRQIQGRTRLLKGWLLHTDLHPDYQPSNHVAHNKVPSLFNCAEGIIAPASIDVTNPHHELALMDIVAHIKAISRELIIKPSREQDVTFDVSVSEDFDIPDNPLKLAVDEYFCAVIDSGKTQSALDYLTEQQLSWDSESWLYQVIGGYEGLADEYKNYFELNPIGKRHAVYTGNYIIHDVELGFK
jgi:hypothetical protein